MKTQLVTTLALATVSLLGACAPNTIIRRTALIPAATAPVRTGLPLEKGAIRVEGHANGMNVGDPITDGNWIDNAFPNVGDPGVLIPDVQLGASVYFGLPKGLELGFEVGYASMEWSHRNAAGVLSFPPGEQRDLFMGGVGGRLTFDLDNPMMSLALIGQLDLATIPEAIFVCVDEERCTPDQFSGPFEASDIYRFERVDQELFILPNVALQLGWRPAPNVMPYLMLGAEASVKNTGFESDPSTLPDDTLESMFVGYVGVGIDLDIEGFVMGGSFYLPFEGEERIDFGPSFAFKIGGRFGGKSAQAEAPAPRPERVPPPDVYEPYEGE
ncbi:MAG: hypothetical protein U1F43_07980 [Myxococcota bacterium]